MSQVAPQRRIPLEFGPCSVDEKKPCKFRDSLSAVEVADEGRTLFLAVDETVEATPTIERMSRTADGYAAHQPLAVADYLPLPNSGRKKGRVPEVDIEGLTVCDGFLWLVGSHSACRKKPKHRSLEDDLERLATVTLEPNRMVLGRVPLVASPDGSTLAKHDGARHSARLMDDLREVLADDPLLGPFLRTYKNGNGDRVGIPGKDNGFDVEGLVVTPAAGGSSRVLLGLRGPVLRGWATILEIVCTEGKEPNQLVLGRVGAHDKRRYKRHLLHLEGLGIRDMRADGDDLLILAGPTMTLDGQVALYRWVGGLRESDSDTVTDLAADKLEHVMNLPHGHGDDRPEGITLLPSGELLVVYDGPSDTRLTGEHGVFADVFAFSGR